MFLLALQGRNDCSYLESACSSNRFGGDRHCLTLKENTTPTERAGGQHNHNTVGKDCQATLPQAEATEAGNATFSGEAFGGRSSWPRIPKTRRRLKREGRLNGGFDEQFMLGSNQCKILVGTIPGVAQWFSRREYHDHAEDIDSLDAIARGV